MSTMARWAPVVVRVVLGLMFVFAGATGFLMTPPSQPGDVGVFTDVMHRTHFTWFVAAAQLAAGGLLVIGRYVPLALVILAAFLYNSVAFHIATSPAMLPVPIVIFALLVIAAWPYRDAFGRFFTATGR